MEVSVVGVRAVTWRLTGEPDPLLARAVERDDRELAGILQLSCRNRRRDLSAGHEGRLASVAPPTCTEVVEKEAGSIDREGEKAPNPPPQKVGPMDVTVGAVAGGVVPPPEFDEDPLQPVKVVIARRLDADRTKKRRFIILKGSIVQIARILDDHPRRHRFCD